MGHGTRSDIKPLNEIHLADYVDDVVREIEERDLRDVVLVGHSLAGITLPLAAERVADRLRRLIDLSNPLPGFGMPARRLE
jgi:pimeloyl-ACP methyl ester carboxylesterase